MLIRKNKYIDDDEEMPMTPMIDIVFQLLIFFLLSAKFIALEGQLASYLPKDKGISNRVEQMELVNVVLELSWEGSDKDGRVLCRTFNYLDPSTGDKIQNYEFPTVDGRKPIPYGPGRKAELVEFGYVVPDFGQLERYLRYRKRNYPDPEGKGLPVTVNFDGKVPWQVVTTILDICTRNDITNFTLSAKEKELD